VLNVQLRLNLYNDKTIYLLPTEKCQNLLDFETNKCVMFCNIIDSIYRYLVKITGVRT